MSTDGRFVDLLAGPEGTSPEVAQVLRALRRVGDQPAPAPTGELAAFLAESPGAGRTAPARGRLGRVSARVASMGAASAIVLGGGAVAMACVGAVTMAHVTSPDPKPPASVSTLLPGRAAASESPDTGQPSSGGGTVTQGSGLGASTVTASPEAQPADPATQPSPNAHSAANHTDGRGQDDQHAAGRSGGPVTPPSGTSNDLWRQGFDQGFGKDSHGPRSGHVGGGPGPVPPVQAGSAGGAH